MHSIESKHIFQSLMWKRSIAFGANGPALHGLMPPSPLNQVEIESQQVKIDKLGLNRN